MLSWNQSPQLDLAKLRSPRCPLTSNVGKIIELGEGRSTSVGSLCWINELNLTGVYPHVCRMARLSTSSWRLVGWHWDCSVLLILSQWLLLKGGVLSQSPAVCPTVNLIIPQKHYIIDCLIQWVWQVNELKKTVKFPCSSLLSASWFVVNLSAGWNY